MIAVAVSGTKAANLSISTYRHLRNAVAAEPLLDEYGPISRLVPPSEYGRLLSFDPAVRRRSQNELMTFSQALHNDLRDYAKLSENEKPLASVSLPTDIFHPVGVVTCALVFKAHSPHASAPMPTWFGLWKHDGFVKLKKRGRVDTRHSWSGIREAWLQAFHGKVVTPGHSILRNVTAADEWVAEAYLETDYSSITAADFSRVLREYAIFEAVTGSEESEDEVDDA